VTDRAKETRAPLLLRTSEVELVGPTMTNLPYAHVPADSCARARDHPFGRKRPRSEAVRPEEVALVVRGTRERLGSAVRDARSGRAPSGRLTTGSRPLRSRLRKCGHRHPSRPLIVQGEDCSAERLEFARRRAAGRRGPEVPQRHRQRTGRPADPAGGPRRQPDRALLPDGRIAAGVPAGDRSR
jgi:hypothetical protein